MGLKLVCIRLLAFDRRVLQLASNCNDDHFMTRGNDSEVLVYCHARHAAWEDFSAVGAAEKPERETMIYQPSILSIGC